MNSKRNPLALAIIIVIGCICLLNIFLVLSSSYTIYPNYPSLAVSLIGLTGVALYLLNNRAYTRLFIVWGIAQPLVITRFITDPASGAVLEAPLWNVYQFPPLAFLLRFTLQTDSTAYEIGLQLPALILSALSRYIYISSLSGREIYLRPLKADSYLGKYLPATATITRTVSLNDGKTWFLVKIAAGEGDVYGLVRHKEDDRLNPRKKKQVLQFLEVQDISLIKEKNQRTDFRNGDWVVMN